MAKWWVWHNQAHLPAVRYTYILCSNLGRAKFSPKEIQKKTAAILGRPSLQMINSISWRGPFMSESILLFYAIAWEEINNNYHFCRAFDSTNLFLHLLYVRTVHGYNKCFSELLLNPTNASGGGGGREEDILVRTFLHSIMLERLSSVTRNMEICQLLS